MGNGVKYVTRKVRASYASVFKPRRNTLNDKLEYAMDILIPKTDTKMVADIKNIIEGLIKAEDGWKGKRPANFKDPLKDGDLKEPAQEAYKGHYFMTVKNEEKPGIIDRQKNEVLDSNDFISGDYCRAAIVLKAFDHKANKGVSAWLNNIQVLEKGEPLSSKSRAEDDFDEVEEVADFG